MISARRHAQIDCSATPLPVASHRFSAIYIHHFEYFFFCGVVQSYLMYPRAAECTGQVKTRRHGREIERGRGELGAVGEKKQDISV